MSTSRIRQAISCRPSELRNASVDGNSAALNPADRIRLLVDSRTTSSSSTIPISGTAISTPFCNRVPCGNRVLEVVTLLLRLYALRSPTLWQQETESATFQCWRISMISTIASHPPTIPDHRSHQTSFHGVVGGPKPLPGRWRATGVYLGLPCSMYRVPGQGGNKPCVVCSQ